MIISNSSDSDRKPQKLNLRIVFWGLLIVVLLTMVIRYGLISVPLERDEGEYAYGGQLILQGMLPYQQLYNMKLPGIYAAYAGLMAVFGQTHMGIHLGLMFINVATIVLIFLLAKQLYDSMVGLVAAAAFAIMSLLPSVQGIFANAEHFIILFSTGGLWILVKALDEDRPWLLMISGLMLGTSFLMKQHGVAFILFGGLYVLIRLICFGPMFRLHQFFNIGLFALGAVIPYGITCMVFMFNGTFEKFWFWTFKYAKTYTTLVPVNMAWTLFKYQSLKIVKSAPLIWLSVFLGLIATFADKTMRPRAVFAFLFFIFSVLAICPGFFFRPHYFILLLPASATLAGISIHAIKNHFLNARSTVIKYGTLLLLAGILIFGTGYQQRQFLFKMTPIQLSRAVYGLNPFPETFQISEFVRANTEEKDRIAVMGSEPQIYFYSNRRSASKFIYMYALMEDHDYALKMQKEMIQDIESTQPKFVIFVNVETSWLKSQNSHTLLLDWIQKYQAQYYVLVGLVDIYRENSRYQWAPNVNWPPHSPQWIAVLQRKT
jgi:4-amino-4-deoxy-L-arabinose transferase-like glycosyltransferase